MVQGYAHFDFLEKVLEIGLLPDFPYDFSRKMFLMLYSINWPIVIAWLSLFLEILANMCNCLLSRFYVTKFKINLDFLIKPSFHMTKKSKQKWKNLSQSRMVKSSEAATRMTNNYILWRPNECLLQWLSSVTVLFPVSFLSIN